MTDWAGVERVVIDAWIEERIAAVSVSLEEVDEGLSERFWEGIAPRGTQYPFITYQAQVDPRDIRGVGTATVMVDAQYLVKVWGASDDGSYELQGTALKAIHDSLTSSIGGSPAIGGQVFDCVRVNGYHLNELVDGKEVRQIGGVYDIHAQG